MHVGSTAQRRELSEILSKLNCQSLKSLLSWTALNKPLMSSPLVYSFLRCRSADMVDWRNGTATSGIPVQSVGGCDPAQQYRHGGQNAPYQVPGAMNGVLHHSQQQQQQQQQQIRRQAAGYPGNAGPGYPGPVATVPGYGQALGGAKAAAGGQYGMGVEYGRAVSK